MTTCGVWVPPQLKWIVVVLLLQPYGFTSAQDVTVEFLTAVPRLSSTHTIDYYFCCNVEGRFLQWQYDNQPLSGFLIDDIGRVFVDKRSDYNYTATLLSSQPMNNNQSRMDSVLVLSFHNGTNPDQFNVTCSSNLNINSTTAGPIGEVKKTKGNEEVQLDYIISERIVRNRNRTYIFMCGARNTPQFIELNGRIFGFSRFDDVGLARTVFLEDRNTADIHGILVTRESYQAITLVLVATSSDVVNVSCYDSVSRFALSLQLQGEKKLSENTPNNKTDDILVATLNPTGSIAKNVTDFMDLSNDPFMISFTFLIISTNVIIVVVMVVAVIVIQISYQNDAICNKRPVSNDLNDDKQECTQSKTQTLFTLSQDETSYSDKANANGPLTSDLHSSIIMPPTEDSGDRMLYISSEITKDINQLVYKRNSWKREVKPEHVKYFHWERIEMEFIPL